MYLSASTWEPTCYIVVWLQSVENSWMTSLLSSRRSLGTVYWLMCNRLLVSSVHDTLSSLARNNRSFMSIGVGSNRVTYVSGDTRTAEHHKDTIEGGIAALSEPYTPEALKPFWATPSGLDATTLADDGPPVSNLATSPGTPSVVRDVDESTPQKKLAEKLAEIRSKPVEAEAEAEWQDITGSGALLKKVRSAGRFRFVSVEPSDGENQRTVIQNTRQTIGKLIFESVLRRNPEFHFKTSTLNVFGPFLNDASRSCFRF